MGFTADTHRCYKANTDTVTSFLLNAANSCDCPAGLDYAQIARYLATPGRGIQVLESVIIALERAIQDRRHMNELSTAQHGNMPARWTSDASHAGFILLLEDVWGSLVKIPRIYDVSSRSSGQRAASGSQSSNVAASGGITVGWMCPYHKKKHLENLKRLHGCRS